MFIVDGLPEGYKVIEAHITSSIKGINSNGTAQVFASITVEKIQPRRIVLEEAGEIANEGVQQLFCSNHISLCISNTQYKWKEVKETDIPLTKENDNLKIGVSRGDGEETITLTRKGVRELIEHIRLGGQLNPKITEFIDYERPEPKLSLSACECKGLFEGNQPAVNKVKEFIKDK